MPDYSWLIATWNTLTGTPDDRLKQINAMMVVAPPPPPPPTPMIYAWQANNFPSPPNMNDAIDAGLVQKDGK